MVWSKDGKVPTYKQKGFLSGNKPMDITFPELLVLTFTNASTMRNLLKTSGSFYGQDLNECTKDTLQLRNISF